MKLFVLGPAGTNGHEVAKRMVLSKPGDWSFDQIDLEFCVTNVEILKSAQHQAGLGVVPIENSTAGLVGDVIKGYWLKQPKRPLLSVIGEFQLPVEHYLLVRQNISHVSQLTAVMSHQQALDQCSGNLTRLGINVRIPAKSTAGAARDVATDDRLATTGALASRFAADTYGLKILEPSLEDYSDNATRFHVVSGSLTNPTGCDRTAIIFWVPNKPNALVSALLCISMGGINMTSTHSIPLGSPGEFAFYVEFECHQNDSDGRGVFSRLRTITHEIMVLGSFPRNIPEKKGT